MKNNKNTESIPEWVEMICDLKIGAGFTYTKIARYLGMSPAEIHRVATGKRHEPRYRASIALIQLYYKVFYSQHCLVGAANYIRLKKDHQLSWIKNVSESFESNPLMPQDF